MQHDVKLPVVTLLIPTYREHDNIKDLVKRISQALAGCKHRYHLFFIDDNSSDGTAELIGELAREYPVSIMVRKDKKGLASAVVDGLEQVDTEIVGVMDADLQHPPEVLPQLIDQFTRGADMVIASRYVPGGGANAEWGPVRRIISKGAVTLSHIFLPQTRGIKDPMSGFFMFNRKGLSGVALNPTGYKILLEIIVLGSFKKIAEIPYVFDVRSQGESKLKTKTQIDYLKHIYSLMKRTGELARFLKFCVVGLSGVGVNLGILTLLTEKAGVNPVYSSALAIEISIITNFLFNNYWTFRDRSKDRGLSVFKRLGKFNLACLAGAAINWGVFNLLYGLLGLYYIPAQLVGIIVATLWNYALSIGWTWK